jgi:hypothetical protein
MMSPWLLFKRGKIYGFPFGPYNRVNFGGETNGKNKKPEKRQYLVERI